MFRFDLIKSALTLTNISIVTRPKVTTQGLKSSQTFNFSLKVIAIRQNSLVNDNL